MTVRWMTAFLDFPPSTFAAGCGFWQAVTASTLSAGRGRSGQFATLAPERGDAFLRVQRLDHGPARCHLDLHVDDVKATATRAGELGATRKNEEPGLALLSSPAGLPFCLVEHDGEAERPPPSRWPDGHHSLVDQICLDIAPSALAAEHSFWTALTGWDRHSGSRPEFAYLARPTGMPLRILLQRLDQDQTDGSQAHLDLACDDVTAERRRHEALGATVVRTTTNWTTLRDPAGLEYCITRRNPETGTL